MMKFIILGLVFLAFIGEPLFIVIGAIAFSAFFVVLGQDPAIVFTDVLRITTAPAMVAIPLFIFAGYILADSRTPKKLVNFSHALLGWLPGGLALVALISCAIFTAFTGASGITIVAVGAILYPALQQDKYPERFSLGLVTIGGGLGTLFIPCLPIILYGVISQTSVEDLFIAGLLPGVLRVAINVGYTSYIGAKYTERPKFSSENLKKAFLDVKWELPLPFIIIVGIIAGFFSASEAAAVAAAYVLIVEFFITKDMDAKKLQHVIKESMKMTGAIIVILCMALGLTNFLIDQEVPMKLFEYINQHIKDKFTFLLLLNLFLLVVGCAMDIYSACVVIVPIIVPIAKNYGIDPVHLGIIFLANLELGFISPPVGMSLFVSSLKFNKSYAEVVKAVLPFLLIGFISLALITYVPDISLFLLNMMGKEEIIDPASLMEGF